MGECPFYYEANYNISIWRLCFMETKIGLGYSSLLVDIIINDYMNDSSQRIKRLKKLWIGFGFFFLFGSSASAQVTHLNYIGTFGIFGTVGKIENQLTQNTNTYEIDTKVTLAGLAKLLLGGQTEHYVSKGHIENGLMVSDFYQMITHKRDKIKSKEYTIDHKKKQIVKRTREWKDEKLVNDKSETLEFYAKDDLLTLYFNLGHATKEGGKVYLFKAVGLEKQDGEVYVTVPNKGEEKAYKKDLGEGAKRYAKALIHQKNFRKKKGDILLAVGEDGFIYQSVIKDILLYGDAKLVRVK